MGLNLVTLLREGAKQHPERAALVAGDVVTSYGALLAQVERFSSALRRLGIGRGMRVALLMPNVAAFSVVYFGALDAGCAVVPLNVLLTAHEIEAHLRDSGCVAVIAWRDFADKTLEASRRAPSCAHVIVAGSGHSDAPVAAGVLALDALLEAAEPVGVRADTGPDDTAVILYTSGTTGTAKGAELSHFNMFFNAVTSATSLFPKVAGVNTVALATLPLFHSFGQTVVHNMTLFQGGCVVLLPRFDPEAVLKLVARHRITFFAGVPTMYVALLNHPRTSDTDLSSVRYWVSGGAAMPAQVMQAFDAKLGANVLEGYGLSETSPVASFNSLDRPKQVGSIGRPIWGVDFKLIDENGNEIGASGVPGEICIRGPNVMKGYLDQPQATAEAIQDGWFRTGDIAQRNDDGYYFIVDRKKDMIVRGGYNVYPREVEEVLYTHPAVAEAAVLGVPNPVYGEEVKAFLALRAGHDASEGDMIAYCRQRLAPFKCPRLVEFCAALPKGPTGKILKRELRRAR